MIELINISKRFVDNVVLDGVSLAVQEGETVALLGPSSSSARSFQSYVRKLATSSSTARCSTP